MVVLSLKASRVYMFTKLVLTITLATRIGKYEGSLHACKWTYTDRMNLSLAALHLMLHFIVIACFVGLSVSHEAIRDVSDTQRCQSSTYDGILINGKCTTRANDRTKRVPRSTRRGQEGPLFKADVMVLLQQKGAIDFLQQFSVPQRAVLEEHLIYCPYNNLCGFSFGVSIADIDTVPCCRDCLCNYPHCMANRSCCPDIMPPEFFQPLEPLDTNKTLNASADLDFDKTPKQLIDDMYGPQLSVQCTLKHARKIIFPFHKQESRLMYATCPLSANLTLKTKCEQTYTFENIDGVDDMVPVTVALDTFRNKYCAECADVRTNLQPWKVKLTYLETSGGYKPIVTGDEAMFLASFFSGDDLDIEFMVPSKELEPPTCVTAIQTCNRTGAWNEYDPAVEGKCALYTSPTREEESKLYYQNVFCAFCNINATYDRIVCDRKYLKEADSYSFSGLIASSPSISSKQNVITPTWSDECENPNQVYDKRLVSNNNCFL